MPNLHALLIGINLYLPNLLPNGLFYNSLRGCVQDVLRAEAFLRTRLNVPAQNIIKLTSSDDGKKTPPEPKSQWPTYENIVKGFKQLTETAQPGDQVFIHFSGHGGRASTTKPFYKLKGKDGIDEVLVPMDLNNSEKRYLRDTEMHYLLNAMVARGLVVTLVLDSCHAAGATRGPEPLIDPQQGQTSVRGINEVDHTPRPSESLVASPAQLVKAWESQSERNTRRAQAGSGWLPEPQGYVLIAACRENEQANEYPFEGTEVNGALSYWLVDSLKQIGPEYTYKMLHDRALARVRGQFASQTPQLEGEGNRVVFSSKESLPQYAVTVIKVNSDRTLTLNAGKVQDVWPGSRFDVFALNEKNLNLDQSIAQIEVVQANDAESHATILKQLSAQTPEPGCQAVLIDAGPLRLRRRIRLATVNGVVAQSEQAAAMKEIADAIKRRPDGFIAIAEGSDAPDYLVTIGMNGESRICDPGGQEIPNLRPLLNFRDRGAMARLVQRLVHLAKYANVRDLDNNDPQSEVPRSLLVELLGKQKNYTPGQKPRPQRFKGAPILNHGEWAFMRVRNNYKEVLNITVLDLQPDWGISQMHPARSGAFETLDPGRELVLRMRFTLPDGYQSGIDVIKVFATVEPTSFRWLELPTLDQPQSADNLRGVPSNELEEILLTFSSADSRLRQASIAAGAGALWATRQIEIEVRR